MANVETRRDENTFLGSPGATYEHIFDERRLDHESNLSRSGLWAKILGEEPLFSCMGLSFEERFGNVAASARTSLRSFEFTPNELFYCTEPGNKMSTVFRQRSLEADLILSVARRWSEYHGQGLRTSHWIRVWGAS